MALTDGSESRPYPDPSTQPVPMRRLALLLILALAAPSALFAQDTLRVRVLDALGDPIAGASVTLEQGNRSRAAITGPDGWTAVPLPVPASSFPGIAVSASGFAPASVRVLPADSSALEVRLEPAARSEQVTVTAGRRASRGSELPADTTVITRRDLESTAAGTIDDALRMTPGFSLFRRSSSRTANPTTQGVTLRGLSASGASRTLVLSDGVPLNDPFGGWVSWNRVPQAAIDRIEVVRGGASDLYGADAAGGVIQLLSIEPSSTLLRALVEGGGQGTVRSSALAGTRHDGWVGSVAGEWSTTDGAIPVAPESRGPIDREAGNDAFVAAVHATGVWSPAWRTTVRGQIFSEDRTNGTPLQDNDTNQRQISGDLAGTTALGDARVRGFAAGQGYDQAFSAVDGSRRTETLTLSQRVASGSGGGSAELLGRVSAVTLLGGVDVRRVHGDLDERRPTGAPTAAEGTQTATGVFAQGTWAPSARWVMVGGLRADRVDTTSSPGGARDVTAVSPKLSVAWTATPQLVARASVYRAFRAPTLNERLRSFRVGNVLTQNNPALDHERVSGGDASLAWERRQATLRVTGFATRLDDAVTNVTLSSTPALITRQRRNAGRIVARGLELEGRAQLHRTVSLAGTLTWTRARFDESDEPGLAGRRVPQVPTAQGGVDARWRPVASTLIALQARWTGTQFDDDRNVFALRRSLVTDLLGEHRLSRAMRGFVAIENLLDADYDTGRTPLRTVGPPRRVRAGFRLNF